MKKYTAFWLTEKAELITGKTPADAFNNAGYGAGALRVLDFYDSGDARNKWEWNKADRIWLKNVRAGSMK